MGRAHPAVVSVAVSLYCGSLATVPQRSHAGGVCLVGSTGFEQGLGENGQHVEKKRGRPIGYVGPTGVLHAGCGASSCAAQRGGGGANPRRWTAKSHPQVAFFASAVAGLSGFSGEEQSLDGVDAVGYPDHRFIGYLSHHFAGVAVAHRDDGAADCFVH